ncbi:MAG: FKBP-type peptidyl-prolyl cis-trans isomerase [Chromatiaceae bacterium]|nr:FKBP-type peptidyl-prolyl cis-trans isomerase [Gammaproteobacteria bacterium]MCP5301278.1 FKBP-type peptidyl-prolyl cis-trans isomerase [Chromatiaceae bacterium]MCP5421956.1 FKBP-type peptidyl-prolyl cis-trans isomerase [Chromatiaceae bacterium]
MKKAILLLSLSLIFPHLAPAADAGSDVAERYSYTMGVRLGQLLRAQGISQLDSASFAQAIDDVLNERTLRLSTDEMRQAIVDQQRLLAEQRAAKAADNLRAGQEFLARNATNADVVALPSGLQYRVLDKGDGEQPGADDTVRVHYQGTLIDGRVFDSSIERGEPAEFPLAGVVPGFREALSLMHVGDRWQVFMPSTLAYGEKGAGADIGPNETLIFEMQLLDIVR